MFKTIIPFCATLLVASALAFPTMSMLGSKGTAFGEASAIPDTAIVEYLESKVDTGTDGAYILSSCSITANNRFVVEFEYLGSKTTVILGRNAGSYECFIQGNGGGYFGGGSFKASMPFINTGRHEIDFDLTAGDMCLTIDGREIKTSTKTQPSRGLFPLFICAPSGDNKLTRLVKSRIYRFSAWHQGELVEDLVPIRFLNENGEQEGAMYNRVTGELYRNQGSDAFVIGPDVAPFDKVSKTLFPNTNVGKGTFVVGQDLQ